MKKLVILILICSSLGIQAQDKFDLLIRSEKILAAGDTSRALAAFSEILRIYPQSFAAAMRLAEVNYQYRDYTKAIDYCNIALDITDNFIASSERSEKILGLPPKTGLIRKYTTDQAFIYYLKANIREAQQQWALAEEDYRSSLALDSMPSRPVIKLAELLTFRGRTDEAESLMISSIRRDSSNIQMQAELANLYLNINDTTSALAALQNIITQDDTYVWAYLQLGNLNVSQQKYGQGIRHYSKYINNDSANAEVYYRRATLYTEIGEYENAIEDWSKAINLDPNNAIIIRNRGLTFFQMNQYHLAAEDFRHAIKIAPEQPYTHVNLGYAEALSGQTKIGLQHIDEGLKIVPNYALGYYLKSLVLFDRHKRKKACVALQKAMELGYSEENIDPEKIKKCF